MDVATLVQSITGSFEDASALVGRIRERNSAETNAKDEAAKDESPATQDLLDSLALGPIVVRGYYGSDAKRFGESYTSGDTIAREQLKDVLIHLQMTVLTTLRTVLVDDMALDCSAIQSASDNCRVNAGVSLGQLSQRLADPVKFEQSTRPQLLAYPLRIPTPPLNHSHSQSERSDSPRTPTTPELEAALDFDYPGRLLDFNPHASGLRGKAWQVLQGRDSAIVKEMPSSSKSSMEMWMRRQMDYEDAESRRPSSSCLSPEDNPMFSPIGSLSSPSWNKASPVSSSGIMSQFGSIIKKKSGSPEQSFKDRFSPDDYTDIRNSKYSILSARRKSPPSAYSTSPTARSRRSSDSKPAPGERARSPSVGRPRIVPDALQSSPPRTFRMPRRSFSGSSAQARDTVPVTMPDVNSSSASINAPIPVTEDDLAPPLPPKSAARRQVAHISVQAQPPLQPRSADRPTNQPQASTAIEPLGRGAKKILGDIDPYLDSFTAALQLPTEKNLMGYCKAAHRLQSGSEKKAFSPANRPVGYSSLRSYWKCERCAFEGPLTVVTPPGASSKSKGEKIFDPATREYDGIRFKWVFLAKCHVPSKITPGTRSDGSSGSFGCLFCTAEGASRGWVGDSTNRPVTANGTNTAVEPIVSASSSGTPIFGNSHSFMEHLQMHRRREYWPNKEMQKKMKCVVGRVAARGEDFDINLMPLEETTEQ